MKSLKSLAIINISVLLCLFAFTGNAVATAPVAGEEALFTSSTQPDALIVLDLSGSMAYDPSGASKPWFCSSTTCDSACTTSSGTGHTVDCSRLAIAKRTIFDVLDDNNDNTINSSDETSLAVNMGYMRFYDCDLNRHADAQTPPTYNYSSGCNTLIKAIGSKYSQIYCGSNNSCTSSSSSANTVSGESALGGTPLASALAEAKLYLDAHKAADTARNCRKKFAILITDGQDTYACDGHGYECSDSFNSDWSYNTSASTPRYKARRDSVAKAKALADAGYKVFVIGFGSTMPDYLENTLNWMAYHGGTDNPNEANSGSTSAYNPANITSCQTDTSFTSGSCAGETFTKFFAASNDPGNMSLRGYAFLAANADALATALKTAMDIIRQANYSFAQSSVQSSRTSDENYLYEGSFEPVDNESFWKGHLKKYKIKNSATDVCTCYETDGVTTRTCVIGDVCGVENSFGGDGDAGTALQSRDHRTRNIKTYRSGSLIHFTKCTTSTTTVCSSSSLCDDTTCTGENITAANVGVTTTAERDAIVGYIRGNGTYNPEQNSSSQVWKLGDVFRSTPITVGTPSAFYDDARDASSYSITDCGDNTTKSVNAFAAHRGTHCRTSANGYRLIVAGANDGQMHAYKTSDGSEAWSFIPPNLLTKMKNMTHSSHPTSLTHQYFVDGPVTVADVWLGSGSGTSKTAACGSGSNENCWKTIMVFGLGRGSTSYSWSSSAYCDSGINATYSASYPYYCGYHALNLNSSLSPAYMWHLAPTSSQAPYLGDAWSKMMTGRVRYKVSGAEVEKWVGFIGGGYNAGACPSNGTCDDPRGKGFYVVDLSDGTILWSFTHSSSTTSSTTSTAMRYSIPAQAAIVDTDNDGFVDLAYIGDLGGNMWRFKFCTSSDVATDSGCGTSNWNGSTFFDSASGNIRPIYTSPAVSKDSSGNLWVYWGTGDKTDPTAPNAQEHFYGVKDNDPRTATRTISDIDNIIEASKTYDTSSTTKVGWRIQLAGGGQKVLADPTIFGGVVYFTTYTPSSGGNTCEQGGTANLYGVNFTTGGGTISQSDGTTGRSRGIGSGIASAPVISMKPGGGSTTPDLYVTTSGSGGTSASTQRVNMDPPGVSNRTNMLYWRDRRLQ